MEYGMLATLIPEAYAGEFRSMSKNTMQDAANALQQNLYRGLVENLGRSFPVFNILPLSSYPQYCTKAFVPRFPLGDGGVNIGFCNIRFLRNYSKRRAIYRELRRWCRSGSQEKTLFVYTISQPFLAAVTKLKKKYSGLRVCAIVADLPNMSNLSARQSAGVKLAARLRAKDAYSMLPNVDRFVLLTKHMADYMNLTQPWCVMEGIAAETHVPEEAGADQSGEKNVMYSGMLHERFGILHLIEAFSLVDDSELRLTICGVGDSESEIRRAAERDSRIRYLGQQKREDVLRLQKQATVLVNPRMNNEEFTKYSFPSKTMEYLASGVPVIAYRLDGIPEEYDRYLNSPADDSPAALAKKIRQICAMSPEERRQIGRKGMTYVLENKNAVSQTKRILEFLKNDD